MPERLLHVARLLARRLPRSLRLRLANWWHRRAGLRPTATWAYRLDQRPGPAPAMVAAVDLLLAPGIDAAEARNWMNRQTLPELRIPGRHPSDPASPSVAATWFAAPTTLPELDPAHLEICLLIAAAEAVDAVTLADDEATALLADPQLAADAVCRPPLRNRTLFRRDAFTHDATTNLVLPRRPTPPAAGTLQASTSLAADPPGHPPGDLTDGLPTSPPADLIVKLVSPTAGGRPEPGGPRRRGPYLLGRDLAGDLLVGLRDAGQLVRRRAPAGAATPILVTAPFLARGGAEHTLLETLRSLAGRFDPTFVTLAPHQPALGDRRPDFRALSPRIYPLGDVVHPDAMLGMLRSILDATGAEVLYNANSTTLFYPFAAQLKRERPGLRIVDHLYDHRVGYIERYDDPALEASIDACVAENHRIQARLLERGWPAARVPVIWPCGRPPETMPGKDEVPAIRQRLRRELGVADHELLVLTAARMHEQKRPLDLVAVAERLREAPVVFLLAGGGPLEQEVDRAIAASGARIRRLPFRDDIPHLIAAADVGCLVSDFEGLPVFLLECLQLGRPFLATRVGDLGDVIDETGAGLVVDRPGDITGLVAAVSALLDPERRGRAGERAAAAGEGFSIARCAERYAAAFSGRPQPC